MIKKKQITTLYVMYLLNFYRFTTHKQHKIITKTKNKKIKKKF